MSNKCCQVQTGGNNEPLYHIEKDISFCQLSSVEFGVSSPFITPDSCV